MVSEPDLVQIHSEQFAHRNRCEPLVRRWWGMDGTIFLSTRQSAIKFLKWQALYERERDVYLRLRDYDAHTICDCNVPSLLEFDDELWAIEMSIVSPPYVLDFAGAFLDQPREYPQEVLDEWMAEKREQFGDQWPHVRRIVFAFEQMGIYLGDLNPNNILLLSS